MKMKTGVFVHVAIIGVGLVVAACSLTGLQGNQNDNGSSTDPSLKLVAQANAGTLVTEVSYAESDVESRFEINVSGGVPGSEIDVVVNGVVVATIVLDASGSAHVEYSNVPDDSGGLLLPDTFVPPQAGDTVAVGELQSEFRDDSSDDDDSDDNGNDNDDDGGSDDNENDNEDDDSDDNGNGNSNDNDDDDTVGNDNSDDNLNENANSNDNSDDSANDNSDDSGNDNVDDDLDNTNSNDNVDDDSGNDNSSTNDNTH